MKFAWIENNTVRDVCHSTPSECYTAEIAECYTTEVGDDIINGAILVNGTWVNPEPAEPMTALTVVRTWNVQGVRSFLTLAEKTKWDSDATATIKTAKIEFSIPQKLEHTTEVLEMLVSSGDISQTSMNKILL